MTDPGEKVLDRCPINIYYVDEGSTPIIPRKRSIPGIDESENLKKLRTAFKSDMEDADSMISRLVSANNIETDSIRSDIKNQIDNTPGKYYVGYKNNDDKLLVPLPPYTYKSSMKRPEPSLLRFDQIADTPVSERNSNLSKTFTSIPKLFAGCEENIQSLSIFLSSDGALDTGRFGSLVAALLDKKTPLERRYLCHKIFSCVANVEDISMKSAD